MSLSACLSIREMILGSFLFERSSKEQDRLGMMVDDQLNSSNARGLRRKS
jgi:hypothetical protein